MNFRHAPRRAGDQRVRRAGIVWFQAVIGRGCQGRGVEPSALSPTPRTAPTRVHPVRGCRRNGQQFVGGLELGASSRASPRARCTALNNKTGGEINANRATRTRPGPSELGRLETPALGDGHYHHHHRNHRPVNGRYSPQHPGASSRLTGRSPRIRARISVASRVHLRSINAGVVCWPTATRRAASCGSASIRPTRTASGWMRSMTAGMSR